MIIDVATCESPIGQVTLAVREGRLCALTFSDFWAAAETGLHRRFGPVEFRRAPDPAGAVRRVRDYFAGALDALDALPVETGGTAFQQRVWTALRTVTHGRTASYRDIARTIGAPAAVRAVGAANGSNPVCLVIPCHRIIGTDGSLTGYGGGLERKRWLLMHEGAQLGFAAMSRIESHRRGAEAAE
jgi:methylated-DNA-[protein]-cysteine S-methyltransferase